MFLTSAFLTELGFLADERRLNVALTRAKVSVSRSVYDSSLTQRLVLVACNFTALRELRNPAVEDSLLLKAWEYAGSLAPGTIAIGRFLAYSLVRRSEDGERLAQIVRHA